MNPTPEEVAFYEVVFFKLLDRGVPVAEAASGANEALEARRKALAPTDDQKPSDAEPAK